MTLHKLIIHNIASIEDAEIDFSASPLRDADVFLISGKTGSGKSTILDAICLALYGKTPRLENTLMEGQVQDSEDNSISLQNPALLLRRNTSEGFVELTFTGNDGLEYKAHWGIRRARNKVTGKLQNKDWTLTALGSGTVLTKDKDIKDAIKRAVGLGFNEFCRTTMLAQGEFSKFLNSDDKNKSSILEKITGSVIYTRIGQKIYEVTASKKERLEEAKRKMQGIEILNPEEKEKINDRMAELDTLTAKQKAASEIESARRDWIKKEAELAKSLSDAASAFEKATAKTEEEGFKKDLKLTQEWQLSAEPRNRLKAIEEGRLKLSRLNTVGLELKTKFKTLLEGLLFESGLMEEITRELKEIEDYFREEVARIPTYDNAKVLLRDLAELVGGRDLIKVEKGKIAENEKGINEKLQPLLTRATENVEKIKKDIGDLQKRISDGEKDPDITGLPALRNRKEETDNLVARIKLASQNVRNFLAAKKRYSEHKDSLESLAVKVKENEKAAEDLILLVEKAQNEERQARETYDSQYQTVNEFAKKMRAKLHVGDECPVCRQKIMHAIASEEEIKAAVDSFKRNWDDALSRLNDLKAKQKAGAALLKSDSARYKEEKTALEKEKTLLENEEAEVRKACMEFGLDSVADDTEEALEKLLKQRMEESSSMAKRISDCEAKEKDLKKLRKDSDGLLKKRDKAVDEQQEIKNSITECRNKISISQNAIDTAEKRNLELSGRIASLVKGEWNVDWNQDTPSFINLLKEKSSRYADTLKDKEKKETRLREVRERHATLQRAKEAVLTLMPAWEEIEPSTPVELKNSENFGTGLISNVSENISSIRDTNASIERNEEEIKAFLEGNTAFSREKLAELNRYSSTDIQQITARINDLEKEKTSTLNLLTTLQRQAVEHQEKKPEMNPDDTLEEIEKRLAEITESLMKNGEEKGALLHRLEEDRKNRDKKASLMEEMERWAKEYEKWALLNHYLGNADGKKFRKIAQSYILESLVHSANGYLNTLSGRYRLRATPGTFIISVEDAYQGGAVRSANTLSGGETFLVSLALALALSDIGERLKVNTLFIDEGFGTLSGEPLQNAITTLRSLHKKTDRHVGIISHVEELREKIPVQILVEQEGASSSSGIRILP